MRLQACPNPSTQHASRRQGPAEAGRWSAVNARAPAQHCLLCIFSSHQAGDRRGGLTRDLMSMLTHPNPAESKRRLNNLLDFTGTLDRLRRVRARPAARAELARVHSEEYIDKIVALSKDSSKGCHRAGGQSADCGASRGLCLQLCVCVGGRGACLSA